MMCQSCTSEARWIIMTPGVEWAGRVCDEHLRGQHVSTSATAHPRRSR